MIETPGATNEQIFWIITTAYLGKAVGVLDKATENKLDALFLDKAQNWTEQVEHALSINESFVMSVYTLCTERNSPAAAIGFILRGLGCPPTDVDSRVQELNAM